MTTQKNEQLGGYGLTMEEERRARAALRPDAGAAEKARRAHEEEMRELIRRQYGRTV